MDSSDAWRIITLFILLVLSAFFSSAETCLTTVNKMRMKSMADEKVKNARIVLKLIENQTKMLSAILIGNNIVNLTASSLTTSFAIQIAQKSGFSEMTSIITGAATGILTVLILIFGEIVPKTLATMSAERLALTYAKPVYAVTTVLAPVAFLMNQISKGLLIILRIDTKKQPAITENELRTIVDVSHKEGVIESEERQMITNVVDFGDSLAKDVMVPKMDVAFANVKLSYNELVECYSVDKFTRMPVYSESRDNVVGIINLKDLFFYQGSKKDFSIADVMREPYFTYEYKKISELFFEMKKKSIPMAIVLDEYGSTAGMLTIEDLIEEIVGEIRDEYDANEEDEITKLDDENYILLGVAKLDDIDKISGIKIESEDYDSIAGHVINLLDHFPQAGESVSDQFARYTVLEAEKNHIDKVKLHLLPKPKEEEEAAENSI
ncbi:HlyC/CorC family transporter [Jutongia hominis]|uniref:HlyC/CorC family transporter n=1 Tax=Jutongia hominis TaxID=2763664 RepID=A0ABR7MY47_9FIRM|nr:hemolysin family protein [Jutongia hominis]MBC8558113.1 HlyC/CorC family transporter [Jutongia hominis]